MKKFYLIISLLIVFNACEKNDKNGEAPEIPPQSSFVMDFSDFQSNKDLNLTALNWTYAALNVAVWNVVLTVNLAIPVASFVEAFNHEPQFSEAINGWVWSYDFYAAGVKHTADLEARFVPDGVQWEMYISQEGNFDRFLWYYGISNLTRTHGTWDLNYNPNDPVNYLNIEWNYNYTDSIGDIKYTVVDESSEQYGSYIEYGLTTNDPYNAYYNIMLNKEQKFTEIMWNKTNKEGRVRDTIHFLDNEWHCWDGDLQDITCN